MNKVIKSSLLCVTILLTLNIHGCSPTTVYSVVRRNQGIPDIKKVGVLPFVNETGKWRASEIVTNIFIAELFKTGIFTVEEKGNIEQFLIRKKIKDINGIHPDHLKRIGDRLHIDAVLIGIVEEFAGGDVGGRLETPVISIRVRMIDVRTGRTIWMARHRRRGDDYITVFDFGRVRSVGALTKRVVLEMIKTINLQPTSNL